MPNVDETSPEGFGCRPTVEALAAILGFAAVAAVAGVSLALGDSCSGGCETLGFTLYAAGLPVSAAFAAVAGELPLAIPLDVTFWVIVSFFVGRAAERRHHPPWRVAGTVIVVAIAYGAFISLFLEAVEA